MELNVERWAEAEARLLGLSVCLSAVAKAIADEKPEFGRAIISRLDELLDRARVENWPSGAISELREQKQVLHPQPHGEEPSRKPSPQSQS